MQRHLHHMVHWPTQRPSHKHFCQYHDSATELSRCFIIYYVDGITNVVPSTYLIRKLLFDRLFWDMLQLVLLLWISTKRSTYSWFPVIQRHYLNNLHCLDPLLKNLRSSTKCGLKFINLCPSHQLLRYLSNDSNLLKSGRYELLKFIFVQNFVESQWTNTVLFTVSYLTCLTSLCL